MTRLAVAGAIGATALAAASPAMAATGTQVSLHVHRADVALHAVASVKASPHMNARITLPLTRLTTQLGLAESLSVNLAVDAKTAPAEELAAGALRLVAGEEAKAQATLTATAKMLARARASADVTVSADTHAAVNLEDVAVLKAELEVTQGREIALDAITHLSVEPKAATQAIVGLVSSLSAGAEGVLSQLISATTSAVSCPSASADAQLVANEATREQGTVDGIGLAQLGSLIDAGGSLLANLTGAELAQVDARVQADLGCAADGSGDGGSGSVSGSVSGTVSGSVSGTVSGSVSGTLTGLIQDGLGLLSAARRG